MRQGLLRVTLHVLQRHGDGLSRGWVPLLRLLEAVPSWEDNATISLAFQSAEAICRWVAKQETSRPPLLSLLTMPAQHVE